MVRTEFMLSAMSQGTNPKSNSTITIVNNATTATIDNMQNDLFIYENA